MVKLAETFCSKEPYVYHHIPLFCRVTYQIVFYVNFTPLLYSYFFSVSNTFFIPLQYMFNFTAMFLTFLMYYTFFFLVHDYLSTNYLKEESKLLQNVNEIYQNIFHITQTFKCIHPEQFY